jgi:cytochrome b subunit of formate dehydrogenase
MSFVAIRRTLHVVHTLTALALIATGLLIGFPDLRARLLGGYGRELADIHVWTGSAFIAAPALALALVGASLYRDLRRRLGPPDPFRWKKFHILLTLVGGALLTASGILLWLDTGLPLAVSDAALAVHEWLTYVLAAALPVHLYSGRRKIAERVRALAGRGPRFESEFPATPADDAP